MKIKLKKAKIQNCHVFDGDTLVGQMIVWRGLRRNKIETRVRFAGIDAPEMKPTPQSFAQESTDYVQKRIEGKTVVVEFVIDKRNNQWILESGGTWTHRRLLGIIYYRWGESLNIEIVRAGLAKIYPSPTWMIKWFHKQLLSAQKQAQRKRRGMWKHSKLRRKSGRFFWFCAGMVFIIIILFLLA